VSISSDREAEMRATSAFLSIVKAVAEFGRTIVKAAKGPAGVIACYTEVELDDSTKTKKSRPDGVIYVTRGKKEWKALVEVKVGTNGLNQEQFDRYHNLAREYGFDALITISNQAALLNGFPPLKVDLRRAKSIPVLHFSWERLLSEAQLLSWQSGVSDEDQQYMLDEWIRYVNDSGARIVVAPKVGGYWKDLLSAAASDQLSANRIGLEEFVNTWCGFLRIQAFRLRALLGERVEVRYRADEKKKPELYIKRLVSEATTSNKIFSLLNISHTAGDLELMLDLRSRRIFFEVDVTPPSDKTTRGQIGWIVNQLKRVESAPQEQSLIVVWKKRGVMSKAPIAGIAENRDALLLDMEKNLIPKEIDIRMFKIQWETKIPRKNADLFTAIGGNLEKFYSDVVENLSAYVPPAPKLSRKEGPEITPANEASPPPMTPHQVTISPWRDQPKE
jgi:hypothetical protein